MKPPASFTTLPAELVANICAHTDLEKEDLCALRLTARSQGIHSFATEELAGRHFTSVPVLYTHYSLHALVEICKHPVFGPSVCRVELSCARFCAYEFWTEVEWLCDDGKRHDHLRQGYYQFSRTVQQIFDRCDFESSESEQVQFLLDSAFQALAKWGHTLTLAISSEESHSIGHNKTYGPAYMGSSHWQSKAYETLKILSNAVEKSGCTVQRLDFDVAAISDIGMKSESNFPVIISQISELSLDFRIEDSYFFDENVKPVIDMLSRAVNLKSLHIHTHLFEGVLYDELATSFASMPLEKLCLVEIAMDRGQLSNALKNLRHTLRHLQFNRCRLFGSWQKLLEFIQKNLHQLDYLFVERLGGSSWMGRKVEFSGVENVQSGVEELLQKREAQIIGGGSASE